MPTKTEIFNFDEVQSVAEALFDETNEETSASITFLDGMITLVVCEIKTCDIQVYHVKETPELYEQMEQEYINILELSTTENDTFDKFSAITNVLANNRIFDDILNP